MYKDKGVKIVFNPNAHKGKSVIFLKYLKSKLDEYEKQIMYDDINYCWRRWYSTWNN